MAFFSKFSRRKSNASWRTFRDGDVQWTEEKRDQLKKDIPKISFASAQKVTKGKLLLLGPIKSGKSSFINSILSIEKDKLVQMAPECGGANSVTRKLNQFMCGNFLVCDTMGLESRDGVGFNNEDILYLLKGNISTDYEGVVWEICENNVPTGNFNQTTPITKETKGFNSNPANADKVHCVIFCMSANEVQTEVQEGYIKKWQALQKEINFHLVPRIMILTKIDDLCKDVQNDLSNTFKSKKVHEVVKKASELFSLPEMYIHPVKNFTSETFPEHKQSILLLLALKQALEFAEDFVNNIDMGGTDIEASE